MMKHILKYILVVFLSFVSGRLLAQEASMITRLYNAFSENLVTLSVDYSVKGSGPEVKGKAELLLQGKAYHIVGGGYDIYCDGESVWIVDQTSKEVIIEPLTEGTEGYMTNPALLLSRLDEFFDVKSIAGRKYTLKPKTKGEIATAEVTFSPEGTLTSGTFTMADGNLWTITVTKMTTTPQKPLTAFRPSVRFDKSWIVTDLR
jgi:outer membrane lipoprotein-sorting protein